MKRKKLDKICLNSQNVKYRAFKLCVNVFVCPVMLCCVDKCCRHSIIFIYDEKKQIKIFLSRYITRYLFA
jgi:hypothetical protein